MSFTEVLDKIGLTKYESEAFNYIILNGPVEAGEISKSGNIPYGKIYETLNKLEKYGFIEIQNSRPKKYFSRNINIAIEEYLEKKKEGLEQEMRNFENLGNKLLIEYEQLHQNKKNQKEEIFYRTAFGSEINDLYLSSLKEAKQSIFYFMPHSIHDTNLNALDKTKHSHQKKVDLSQERDIINKFLNLDKKGINVKILYTGEYECPFFKSLFSELLTNDSTIEFKASKENIITPPLLLIDDAITMMDIIDPLDNHTAIGLTKIWDRRLHKNLKDKIDILWKKSRDYKTVFLL